MPIRLLRSALRNAGRVIAGYGPGSLLRSALGSLVRLLTGRSAPARPDLPDETDSSQAAAKPGNTQVFDNNSPWLRLALTHCSLSARNNERLEFFGDALLDFVLSEEIYKRYPEADEGKMTLMRANLANQNCLAALARQLELDKAMARRFSERGLAPIDTPKVLAGVFEAWLAAVYFEFGLERAREVIEELYRPHWSGLGDQAGDKGAGLQTDKALLQELLQKRGHAVPVYRLVRTEGKEHQLTFYVECSIEELGLSAPGEGTRQRFAENDAAGKLYERLLKDS